ncbi:MAG: hypothetical protein JKY70_01910 [Mucilaginibacter sp.]|nr:hypothetical protein [Mucilaginibacter sp.]
MNKLFNHISWSTYLDTCILIAVAYYLFIIWKYYRSDIQKIFNRLSGNTNNVNELPAVLQYQPDKQSEQDKAEVPYQPEEAATDEEFNGPARGLAIDIYACIEQAADEPFAPAILIPKLKIMLNEHPGIAATPDREKINAFVARECEKTGTALLSESEVDRWWSA